MNIRAAVLHAVGSPLMVETLSLEDPHTGEVLVRMEACGVCHSDYHLMSGDTPHPLPAVLGHEGAGVVEAVGDGVVGIQPGDHVVLNWAPNCGDCYYCSIEKPNLCSTFHKPIWAGTMLDGTPRLSLGSQNVFHYCSLAALAEYAVVPQQSCVVIDSEIPLEVASVVGCAVTTGVGAALYTAPVRPGDCVAVFGCGGVGLSIILGARLAGAAQIIALDRTPEKLALTRKLGADEVVLAEDQDAVEQIRQLTDGRGADITFEAVGSSLVQQQAVEAARPGGTAVFVGLSPVGTELTLSGAAIARQEKAILGSYYGSTQPKRDFPRILDLYKRGRLDLDALITHRWSLDEVNQAFEAMLAGEVARGVVRFRS